MPRPPITVGACAGLEIVAELDAADAGGIDTDAVQPQLVDNALAAVGHLLAAQVEDLLLDGLGDPYEMRLRGPWRSSTSAPHCKLEGF